MKKFLLLFLMCVYASIGAWAVNATITGTGGHSKVTITTNDEPDLASLASSTALSGNWGSNTASDNAVEVIGTISQAGLDVINTMMSKNSGMYFPADKILYLNQATFSGTIMSLPAGTSTSSSIKFASCILPANSEIPETIPSGYNYVYSPCTSGNPIHIYVKEGTTSISQLTSEQIAAASSIIITGSGKDAFIANLSDAAKDKLPFDGSIAITTTSTDNVQAKVEAYLINKGLISNESTAEDKAAVLAQITSLTIAGPLTSADITYLSNLTRLEILDLTRVSSFGTGVSKTTINSAVASGATVTYPSLFYNSTGNVSTFTVLEEGGITETVLTNAGVPTSINDTSIKIVGNATSSDITNILAHANNGWATKRVDLSEATLNGSMPRLSGTPDCLEAYYIILPPGTSAPTDGQIAFTSNNEHASTNGIYNGYGTLKYIVIPASENGGHAKVFINNDINGNIPTELQTNDISLIATINSPSVIDVYNLNNAFGHANYSTLQTSINALTATDAAWEGKTIVYHSTMNPMEITGCNVTIDMNEANGKDLATLISEAKTEVVKTIPKGICSLTINGPLSADDITALNTAMGTGEDLASIESLNLGGATGMAQTDVDALEIPANLTRLTIPADRIVDGNLKTTLATPTFDGLTYVYSPSSDSQKPGPDEESQFDRTKNLVADYVWVNRQNALPTAFTNEEQLRNSYNIKVASSVELTATDVNFDALGTNKPSNYLFLNFSDANLTPAVAASYTVTDDIGYRIILPNNWTGDQMAVFAANPHCGKLAAVYSYNGTKLNIMEIKDESYSPAALADPRIVRAGTTEVSVISGTYNGETYANFGDHLLAALNNMGKSEFDYNSSHYNNTVGLTVTKVSIETGSNVPNAITFDNPTIQTLELKNVGQGWSSLNVNACSSLQTLNLNHINLGNVSAKVPAASSKTGLTSINLSGATINGSADFSTSPLTSAFTMDDDTHITSDLLLKSTGLTSFTPKGTVGGDIYLNASNNLASLDVRQFTQAATKKIHIDADATDESGTAVISGLDNGTNKTITVPTGYKSSERFHPYDAISDNIAEAAYVPPMYTTSTTTMMLHEKNANTDGDNYIYWYDDPTNQGTNVTLGTSTESGHSLAEILTSEASNLNFGTTTYRRAKIDGPITSTDIASLASINCQVLDLSSATFDEDAWTALKTKFKTSGTNIHTNVRFVILPSNSTRGEEIINGTALAGLTNVLSVIALNKITGATDASDNGTNLTSWNRVSGALQAAVVAAGNHSCQSWTKTPDGKTSRNIYTSDISDFRECKISGLINSHDLSKGNQKLDANGHLSWDKEPVELSSGTDPRKLNGACTAYGPFSASFNLSVIDLQGAFFEEKGDNTDLADKDKRYYFQDMTLSALGIISEGTYKVVVPTDPRAKEIPADFMNCSTKIRAICIPSNIVAIRTRAFYTIDYVWTTATNLADTEDPEGSNTKLDNGAKLKIVDGTTYLADGSDFTKTSALIYENGAYKENPAFTKKCYVADYGTINGGGTYTFGSNLRLIETGAFANTQPNVKDVYVLNTKAPECHVDAFNTVMYTGNGGYNPTAVKDEGIITREAYYNGRWITMLHYPRQTTDPQIQRYTDPTRSYSIATGLRDGKGAILYFPNQSEFIRAYQQGTFGYTWNAWNPTRVYGSVVNGDDFNGSTNKWTEELQTAANALFDAYTTGGDNHKYTSFYKVSDFTGKTVTEPKTTIVPYYNVNWSGSAYTTVDPGNLYPQSEIDKGNDADNSGEMTTKDYRGWHQFVLNAYAANTVLDEEPYRSYITDNEWWTIVPEFDITLTESALLFGKYPNYTTTEPTITYPRIHKLRYVRREYSGETIYLSFTKDLATNRENRDIDAHRTGSYTRTGGDTGEITAYTNADQHGRVDGNGIIELIAQSPAPDDVVMSAGVPYLIKPNLPANGQRQYRIFKSSTDAGNYNSTRTSTDPVGFGSETLWAKIKFAQEMNGATQRAMVKSGTYTVPVFVSVADGENVVKEAVEMDGDTKKVFRPNDEVTGSTEYYRSTERHYTFVGTLYKSFLPHYCYFLGWDSSLNSGKGGAKFYYHNGNFTTIDNEMRWANGTGVIVPVLAEDLSEGEFKYDVTVASDMANPAQWTLLETFADDSFKHTGGGAAKQYVMDFNAPDMIADDSDVTGIENVNDDSNINNIEGNDINVYTINGQKVGTSLEGLSQGIYIVNGKKHVVK